MINDIEKIENLGYWSKATKRVTRVNMASLGFTWPASTITPRWSPASWTMGPTLMSRMPGGIDFLLYMVKSCNLI